jgi:hypothetical protein
VVVVTERWTLSADGYALTDEEPHDLEPEPEAPQDNRVPRKSRPRKRRKAEDAP